MELSEDILHKTQIKKNNFDINYNEHIFNEALIDIEEKLIIFGKHLKDFHCQI
jgi:hypothetical protein